MLGPTSIIACPVVCESHSPAQSASAHSQSLQSAKLSLINPRIFGLSSNVRVTQVDEEHCRTPWTIQLRVKRDFAWLLEART